MKQKIILNIDSENLLRREFYLSRDSVVKLKELKEHQGCSPSVLIINLIEEAYTNFKEGK